MNWRLYIQLIVFGLILNLAWAFLSTWIEYAMAPDRENPQGALTAIGFIVLYAFNFFLFMRREKQTLMVFLATTFFLLLIFTVTSFFVPMLFVGIDSRVEYLAFVGSAFVASFSIIRLLGFHFELYKEWRTIWLTTLMASVITILCYEIFFESIERNGLKRIIHPMALLYCCWQVVTTMCIGLSIAYRKNTIPANSSLA